MIIISNGKHVKLQGWRPLQPDTVSNKESVNEMTVPDSRWSAPVKLINGFLDTIAKTLNEVAHNQEAGAVVSIVAVNANQWPWQSSVSPLLHLIINLPLKPINQRDEIASLIGSRRNLGDGRMLAITNATFFHGCRIVHWTFVADVNDSVDAAAVFLGEKDWVVLFVDLAKHLHRSKGVCDW